MDAGTKIRGRKQLARLGLLVLLCACWPGVTGASAQESKTYVSQKHGFSFQYPAAYELQGARDYLDFKRGGKTIFSLRVDDRFIEMLYQMLHPGIVMYRPGEEHPYRHLAAEARKNPELFRRYARQEAKGWCSADGPDGSVYCDEFKNEKPFFSRGGFDCLELQLIVTREDFSNNTKKQQEAGPVFAVFLPQEDLPVLVTISPLYGELAPPTLVQEMRGVIDSLKTMP